MQIVIDFTYLHDQYYKIFLLTCALMSKVRFWFSSNIFVKNHLRLESLTPKADCAHGVLHPIRT